MPFQLHNTIEKGFCKNYYKVYLKYQGYAIEVLSIYHHGLDSKSSTPVEVSPQFL